MSSVRKAIVIGVLVMGVLLSFPQVEAEPKLTVAPEIVYPGDSIFISVRNTTANQTFVIYILNQRGYPVGSVENDTDENGSWAGEIFVSVDELGYPALEFGMHTAELHVNRTIVKGYFEIPYDDNYRWKVDTAHNFNLVGMVMDVLESFLIPQTMILGTLLLVNVVLLVAIYYLAVRPIPGIEALSDWIRHRLRTLRLGRAYPETTAHLRRNVAQLTFYQKKQLKWEAMVKLRDTESLLRTLRSKLDRIDEIHEYFKSDIKYLDWINCLLAEIDRWEERGRKIPIPGQKKVKDGGVSPG